ncbi:MAG: acyl-CoA dehydrogenase family protein, partial [Gammaproteobacteria bacterium]|nr:acyl-CoA dehydrogenase family protein [Gammaproteobacteria bacterium]
MGDPLDLLDVGGQLSDEERAVEDSVARFVSAEVLPIIGEAFDAGRFPRELVRPMAELGLLGSSLAG